jgi:hypothetical protein
MTFMRVFKFEVRRIYAFRPNMPEYCAELSCANHAPCKEHRSGFKLARIVDVRYLAGAPVPPRAIDWLARLARIRYGPGRGSPVGRLGVGFVSVKAHKMIRAAAMLAVLHPTVEFVLELDFDRRVRGLQMPPTRYVFRGGKCEPIVLLHGSPFKHLETLDYANLNAVDATDAVIRICTETTIAALIRQRQLRAESTARAPPNGTD